jgi:hypothetical protein
MKKKCDIKGKQTIIFYHTALKETTNLTNSVEKNCKQK